VTYLRNLEGSVAFRLLSVRSGNNVPFYFQPTLGGADINGERLLAGYDDYRFRGRNLLAFQESVEHSVWGPVGAYALVEQSRVTDGGTFGTHEQRCRGPDAPRRGLPACEYFICLGQRWSPHHRIDRLVALGRFDPALAVLTRSPHAAAGRRVAVTSGSTSSALLQLSRSRGERFTQLVP
jgi:hypothetical protein